VLTGCSTELREKKLRASLAAKQALADHIAELGAVTLRAAAVERGIDPDMAGMWAKAVLSPDGADEWAKDELSTSLFRGPRCRT
jgi:hypothetical protein